MIVCVTDSNDGILPFQLVSIRSMATSCKSIRLLIDVLNLDTSSKPTSNPIFITEIYRSSETKDKWNKLCNCCQ